MKNVILSAKSLCKSFASNGTQNHVLSNINLDIYKSDFTVVMGSSGSGKSTLLYCLSGMDNVTSGSIIYNGEDVAKWTERRLSSLRSGDFGFVFQQSQLVSNLSLYENIAVPGYISPGVKAKDINRRARELLKYMKLESVMNQLPSQVSGGEAQRAAIARALISRPKLLFADEPTGALNRANTNVVLDLLTELNADGQSILMVTHDIRAALRATRLLYLTDGKVSGEMELAPYTHEESKAREMQINAWLTSMSW
ncbi:MAG TPA: ABC transporter ATP-binding protein [Ruminiclostridium sp.]|nr:ABC transporter ATP-binding protein [Ruminiclostridium sp.]